MELPTAQWMNKKGGLCHRGRNARGDEVGAYSIKYRYRVQLMPNYSGEYDGLAELVEKMHQKWLRRCGIGGTGWGLDIPIGVDEDEAEAKYRALASDMGRALDVLLWLCSGLRDDEYPGELTSKLIKHNADCCRVLDDAHKALYKSK